jgi:hypothetical protein
MAEPKARGADNLVVEVLPTCSNCGKDIHSGKLSPHSFLRSSLVRDPSTLISAACSKEERERDTHTQRKLKSRKNQASQLLLLN